MNFGTKFFLRRGYCNTPYFILDIVRSSRSRNCDSLDREWSVDREMGFSRSIVYVIWDQKILLLGLGHFSRSTEMGVSTERVLSIERFGGSRSRDLGFSQISVFYKHVPSSFVFVSK